MSRLLYLPGHPLPRQVLLPGQCSLLSSGYFHCVAGTEAGGLHVWGSNPQVLRG